MAAKAKSAAKGTRVIESNRRARFEYDILETFEAGIALVGSEVKAIREGGISLKEAYCQFKGEELFLLQAHVAEYRQAHGRNHEPLRARKLLLHRRELARLQAAVTESGMAIVPLSMYVKDRRIKVEIALARGKKLHDKRHSIRERELRIEMQRALRERR